MKHILSGTLLALAMLTFNTQADIIDNEDQLQNSYKDTDTGLVWMDFGVNNLDSYNYVSSQLGVGGKYEGWRQPTIEEVYTMWSNVAALEEVDAAVELPHEYGPDQLYALDTNPPGTNSIWSEKFKSMGHNWAWGDSIQLHTGALGWFAGNDGLSYVRFDDSRHSRNQTHSVLFIKDDRRYSESSIRSQDTSTLLVRVTNEVPEPSALAIFLLALMGVRLRHAQLVK